MSGTTKLKVLGGTKLVFKRPDGAADAHDSQSQLGELNHSDIDASVYLVSNAPLYPITALNSATPMTTTSSCPILCLPAADGLVVEALTTQAPVSFQIVKESLPVKSAGTKQAGMGRLL